MTTDGHGAAEAEEGRINGVGALGAKVAEQRGTRRRGGLRARTHALRKQLWRVRPTANPIHPSAKSQNTHQNQPQSLPFVRRARAPILQVNRREGNTRGMAAEYGTK